MSEAGRGGAEAGAALGRPVLVSGATSGIGRATAGLLAAGGFRVLGGRLPGEDETPLRELGVTPIALDVTDAGSVEGAGRAVAEALSGESLWGLVNCAGVVGAAPVEHCEREEMERVFAVNVFGLAALTRAFLPQIREARGRIVNLSSLSALLAVPFLGPYNASKAAVESLSDTLRREVGPLGVEVVVIEPGVTRTPLWRHTEGIDLAPLSGTPYAAALERVFATAVRKGGKGQPPERVAEAILKALTEERPPTRIRVQRKRKARLRYALLPLLPDRLVDRLVADRVWRG